MRKLHSERQQEYIDQIERIRSQHGVELGEIRKAHRTTTEANAAQYAKDLDNLK